MPTPRQVTSVAQQLRASLATDVAATADWVSAVIVTADGNTTEKYTVQLGSTGGVVDATSSVDAELEAGSPVWVTLVGNAYVIVGVQ